MKKNVVGLSIFALIFALAAAGAVAMELITIEALGFADILPQLRAWISFSGIDLLFLAPFAVGVLLFIVLFILVFTRHRPRKLFTGLNVLIVTAIASVMVARVISKDLVFFTMTGWTDLLNLKTAYQAGALLLMVLALLFVLIASLRSISARDYKPKYAHVKLKDTKAKDEVTVETKVQEKNNEPQRVVVEVKLETPNYQPQREVAKEDVKTELVKEQPVVVVEAAKPEPEAVAKAEPKKEVVVKRVVQQKVVAKQDNEAKPLYNFQKKRTTPKPDKVERAKPVLPVVTKKVEDKPVAKPVVKKEKAQPAKKVEPKVEAEAKSEPAKTGPSSEGKRVYHLNKRDEDNKWTIIFAGGKRVIKLCDTQKEAIEYVEGLVANNGGTYLVHNSRGANKGRIQKR